MMIVLLAAVLAALAALVCGATLQQLLLGELVLALLFLGGRRDAP